MKTRTQITHLMLFNLQRTTTHFTKVSHLIPLITIKHHSSIPTKYYNLIKPTHFTITTPKSFQQHLLEVSHLNPRTTRKFWRQNELKPQDFLELILGFESNVGKLGVNVKKVESLLGLFKWVGGSNNKDWIFMHLDVSFKIMVKLLVRAGLCDEAERVVLVMDKEGILLDDQEVCSGLVEWYVGVDELEKSVGMFDRMRGMNLNSSVSCYRTLLDYLVCKNQSTLLFRVYGDMVDKGMVETDVYVKVIRGLCRDGKVLESRNLVKKTYGYGIKPNSLILDAVASGYCEKKDYGDLLSLFIETDCFPDVMVGNKIINSICRNLGVVEAFEFLKELERLGYTSDAITFGILIGWSCKDGDLKNAFYYLSNVLSRGLKPHKYSYNAIISAVFKHGMWNHANDIVLDMEDEGVTLDISTFRVLLAGYCKNRQFDEVKLVIEKMVKKGLIELSPLQDPVAKAFLLLGIDPLSLKVRRDNDVALSKTEFHDSVGNGLYLEGDVVDFDQTMVKVLDKSMVPDYNLIISKDDDLTTINELVHELVHWGQELSVSGFSTLVKKFHKSNSGFKTLTILLENTPNLHNNLDQETLNLLVQAYAKRGFVHKSKKIFDEMVNKKVNITGETYAALAKGLCKKGNSNDIRECCDLVQNKNWLPTLNDYKTLIHSLCRNSKVLESLFLFVHAVMDFPNEVTEIFNGLLENLCANGFTKTGRALFQELLEKGYRLDQVAYSHILSGLCKENRFSEAFIFSNEITTPNVDFYNVLLHEYCAVKDLMKVKEVFGTVIKKNITVYISSYSKFVSLMCHECRFGYAFSLKDLMVRQSLSRITLYNILIFHLFASTKNGEYVDMLLDEIQETGLEFDDVTYNFLVQGFSSCESGSRSVYYLTEMMSKDLKPSNRSIRAVTRFLLKEGEFNKVLNLSQEMVTKNQVHCSIVQNEIVTGFLNTGKIQEAVNFLENMIRKDLILDNINYDNIIKKMCLYGRKDTAFDLLDIMLIKGNVPDSTTYDCLIQDLCVSNIDDSLDLYTEMVNRKLEPSIKTYEVLTEKLCEVGRTLEGEKIIDDMIRVGEKPSKEMFGSVVSRYRFERNFTKASELIQRMQQFGYKPDFETHWSLISTLSRFSDRDKDDNSSSFLSKLLSESGFKPKKGANPKSK
ncbi:pentatricopeptide repeat-containing protein At5g15280, mitochondrial-like [Bidens hawaiensis]|uniref:pentatricopeptide repeat-containing protein At5g15280, mitochondrial-like n=1 Tax=Bidens hawaiensis TaxID=980011 RepID=UPI00404AFB22